MFIFVVSCPTSNGKWACEACTYLNWERAGRCVQCYTTKPTKGACQNVAGRADSPPRANEQCEAASVRICSSSPPPSDKDGKRYFHMKMADLSLLCVIM